MKCWLIESRGADRDRVPMFWHAREECSEWTSAALATRFSRREDAEAVIRVHWSKEDREAMGFEATEHVFGEPCEACAAKDDELRKVHDLLIKAVSLLQQSVDHLPRGRITRVHRVGDQVRDFLGSADVEDLYADGDA